MSKFIIASLVLSFCTIACSPPPEGATDAQADTRVIKQATGWEKAPEFYPDHLLDLKPFKTTKEEDDYIRKLARIPVTLDENDRGRYGLGEIRAEYEQVKYYCSDRYDPAYYPFGLNYKRYILEMRNDTATHLERLLERNKIARESCSIECPELYPVYAKSRTGRQDCATAYHTSEALKKQHGISD